MVSLAAGLLTLAFASAGPLQAAAEEGALAVPDISTGQMAMVGATMLLFGLVLIPVWRFVEPRLLERSHPAPRAFKWMDLVAVVMAFLLGQIGVVQLAFWWIPDFESVADLGAVEALGLTAAGFLVPSVLIVAASMKRSGGARALGLTHVTPGHRLTFSAAIYLASLPAFYGLAVLSKSILTWMREAELEQEVASLIQAGLAEHPLPILLFAVLIVPLMEEILFRGFLLELLSGAFGKVQGVVLSSAAFALLHGAAAALPIFGLALVLSLVKLRTRSLVACWFVHALHNGGTTFLLWVSTQLPTAP